MNHYNLRQPDSFWEKLWSLDISDRIKIFAWKCLKNALSTNLKLSKLMEDVHPYRSFGCSEEESIEHILIFCPYAKVVWASEPNPVKDKDLISSTWSSPKKNQFKINIDATWNSKTLPAGFSLIPRNDGGDFEKSRAGPISDSTPEEAESIGMRQGAKWAVEHGLANFLVEGDCKNLIDYLNGKESGIEWQNQAIMEEVKRSWREAGCILAVDQHAEKAEAQDDLEGIKWAVSNQVINRQLEGDCVNVVNAINGKVGSVKWTTNSIIRDCQELLRNFNKWECVYVPRETNEVVDLLAKDARLSNSVVFWSEKLPQWLSSLISEVLDVVY
ncbi:uncharacterized protein LOC113326484 [Papaver somniferum]|uniref:uncharacterized protein LOC113326484 n=1 Tax=Papaver somniferum TaxID=3469 RepID=UPI000E6FE74F|nr:uncharacterized protein LOC113326484 [Papaver somniferum]